MKDLGVENHTIAVVAQNVAGVNPKVDGPRCQTGEPERN